MGDNIGGQSNTPIWFNQELSNKLNLPKDNNFVKRKARIHFGDQTHDNKFCEHFKFINKTDALDLEPVVFVPNMTEVKKLQTKLSKAAEPAKIKEFTTKLNKKIENLDKATVSEKITIYPTEEQKKTLHGWFKECIKVYNKCVDLYTNDKTYFNPGYQKCKIKVFEQMYGSADKPCPYDILTDEVRIFCSNLKSCKTNKTNGHIKHYELTHKKLNRNNDCIFIPRTAVKNDSIYKRVLKKMIGLEGYAPETDCRLNYIKDKNRYELITIIYKEKQLIENRAKVVALDPGEKIFMAYFSENSFGKIGDNIREKILHEEKEIRRMQRILSQKKNKKGKRLHNKKKIIKRIRRRYEKIKNIVKELHNKTALFLCKTYDRVLIPRFETQQMVRNNYKTKDELNKIKEEHGEEEMKKRLREIYKKKRLSGRVKFVLNMLSHFRFRQHLMNKGNEYGCQISEVTEEYTSKTCTNCGVMSNKYTKREKSCDKCGYKIDRDLNGSRNILIKNVQ